MKKVLYGIAFILIAGGAAYFISQHASVAKEVYKTPQESDPYVRFVMEGYDSIRQNYWEDPKNYDLGNILKLSLEKASGGSYTLASSTRDAVAAMVGSAISAATTTDAKKNLAINTLMIATYNLQPAGRSGVLSTVQETQLRQNVANVNPAKDLYQDLGLSKGAGVDEVSKAYDAKSKELSASSSPEAKAELDEIAYAKKVLANPDSKTLYDQGGVEPTVWPHVLGNTLYLYISKISPTTLFEFAKAVDNASTTKNIDSLILDVRGNVGGALDFAQNFLGLFAGQNQYAFDLFHQGNYDVQRTVQPKFAELDRFGEIAILTDNMTQSTAEVISAMMKRMHLAKTVGSSTRGWGTVENTYPLNTEIATDTKYSLLLVNSITLRDDNQPIEGRGVDPDVNTGDKDWKAKLSSAFHSTSLIKALSSEAADPPLK
jgi:C-terminal processing protease CtpA/Prc